MTRERALELAQQHWNMARPEANIAGVIAEAILAVVSEEREFCAKLADECGYEHGDAEDVAREIRARGAQKAGVCE